MKITSAIVLISISLCAGLCCRETDDFIAPQINIENDAIVQIENNQNIYTVGDSIFIETTISLNQTTTDGNSIVLSDYDYSEINESKYRYSLELYRQNDFGTTSKIPLTTSNINAIEGNTFIENGTLFIEAHFDGSQYINKCSISLAESGTYYLAGQRFLIDNNGELSINGGVYEFGWVTINSTIIDATINNAFEFTVN